MFYLHPFKSIRTNLYSPNLVSTGTGTLTPNVNFHPDLEFKCKLCGPKFKCQGNSRYHRGVCNTIKGGEMLELKCCKVFWCFGEYHHSPAPSPSSVYNELYKYST